MMIDEMPQRLYLCTVWKLWKYRNDLLVLQKLSSIITKDAAKGQMNGWQKREEEKLGKGNLI